MKPALPRGLLAASVILLAILACRALVPVPDHTPILTPAPPTPTGTPIRISQQATPVSLSQEETNQNPPFRITSQTPQLAGSDDLRVQAFNQRLNNIVAGEVESFRQSFLQNTAPPITETGSALDVTYELVSQIEELWSLKLDFSFYSDGAAHPGLYSITVNYDLAQGRELALADLFIPGSDYLNAISDYCIAELGKQPYSDSFFLEGADPVLENYRSWNITNDGLRITFDAYQVAPYAAGPQTVLVPYGELQGLIDLQGPLAGFLR